MSFAEDDGGGAGRRDRHSSVASLGDFDELDGDTRERRGSTLSTPGTPAPNAELRHQLALKDEALMQAAEYGRDLLEETNRLNEANAKLVEERDEARRELESNEKQYAKMQEKLKGLQTENLRQTRELEDKENRLEAAQRDLKATERRVKEMQTIEAELRNRSAEAAKEVAALTKRAEAADAAAEQASAAAAAAVAASEPSTKGKGRRRRPSASPRAPDFSGRDGPATSHVGSASSAESASEVDGADDGKASIGSAEAKAIADADELAAVVEALEQEKADLEDELKQAQEELDGLTDANQGLTDELAEKDSLLTSLRSANDELQRERRDSEARRGSITVRGRSATGSGAGAEAEMDLMRANYAHEVGLREKAEAQAAELRKQLEAAVASSASSVAPRPAAEAARASASESGAVPTPPLASPPPLPPPAAAAPAPPSAHAVSATTMSQAAPTLEDAMAQLGELTPDDFAAVRDTSSPDEAEAAAVGCVCAFADAGSVDRAADVAPPSWERAKEILAGEAFVGKLRSVDPATLKGEQVAVLRRFTQSSAQVAEARASELKAVRVFAAWASAVTSAAAGADAAGARPAPLSTAPHALGLHSPQLASLPVEFSPGATLLELVAPLSASARGTGGRPSALSGGSSEMRAGGSGADGASGMGDVVDDDLDLSSTDDLTMSAFEAACTNIRSECEENLDADGDTNDPRMMRRGPATSTSALSTESGGGGSAAAASGDGGANGAPAPTIIDDKKFVLMWMRFVTRCLRLLERMDPVFLGEHLGGRPATRRAREGSAASSGAGDEGGLGDEATMAHIVSFLMRILRHFQTQWYLALGVASSLCHGRDLYRGRWIPDDDVDACMSCSHPFRALWRRHHCRACGGIYCGLCSGKRFEFSALAPGKDPDGDSESRVCDSCFGVLTLV